MVITDKGRFCRKIKRELLLSAAAMAATSEVPRSASWMASPPKQLNQAQETMVGRTTQAMANSRTVRPLEILARKPPTKGENANHQAQ